MNNDSMLKEILLSAKTIASVGLSSNPQKESYGIALYMKEQGYRVIPHSEFVAPALAVRPLGPATSKAPGATSPRRR